MSDYNLTELERHMRGSPYHYGLLSEKLRCVKDEQRRRDELSIGSGI